MKIIKHGKFRESVTTYEFECARCGCIYTVEEPELKYSSENAYPRYMYTNCPECRDMIPTDYARICTSTECCN